MKKWGCYMLVVPYQDAPAVIRTEQRAEVFDSRVEAEAFAERVFARGLSPRAGTLLRVLATRVEEIPE